MFPISKTKPFIESQREVYLDDDLKCNFCGKDIPYYETDYYKYIEKTCPEYEENDKLYRNKLKNLHWCPDCHRLSGECCTIAVNGCAFDTHFSKAVIGFELDGIYTEGNPIIEPNNLKNFIDLVKSERLILKTWCACPGFCPLYSICQDRNEKRRISKQTPRGSHNDAGSGFCCCKFKKLELSEIESLEWPDKWKDRDGNIKLILPNLPSDELLQKYPTLQTQLNYARNNVESWPYNGSAKMEQHKTENKK